MTKQNFDILQCVALLLSLYVLYTLFKDNHEGAHCASHKKERFANMRNIHNKEGLNHLKEGMGHLKEGMGHLKEGLNHKEGMGHMKEGMGHLKEGMGHLKEGMGHLKEGVHHK